MDTTVKPQGCTHLRLRQLLRSVAQRYDAELAAVGLKGAQYSLLSYVAKLGPIRPGELAREIKTGASTLTRNLKPLIDAGWVTLEPGVDGRSRLVDITPAGRDKRQEAQRRWRAAQESINQSLGVERVLALHALVDECMDMLPASAGATETE